MCFNFEKRILWSTKYFNDYFDYDTNIAKNDNSYKLIVNDNK